MSQTINNERNGMLEKLKYFGVLLMRKMKVPEDEAGFLKFLPNTTQLQILDFLLKNNNHDVTQHDVEDALNLSPSTVYYALATLEKRGVVVRRSSDDDARSRLILLTETAETFFKNSKHEFGKVRAQATAGLSPREIKNFEKTLDKMIANLTADEE